MPRPRADAVHRRSTHPGPVSFFFGAAAAARAPPETPYRVPFLQSPFP